MALFLQEQLNVEQVSLGGSKAMNILSRYETALRSQT